MSEDTAAMHGRPFGEQALELSRSFIVHFYHNDIPWCIARCLPDVVFIGSTRDMFAIGYDELRHRMETVGLSMRRRVVSQLSCTLAPAGSDTLAVVTARFLLASDPASGQVLATQKRATLIWQKVDGQGWLSHFHASTPYGTTVAGAAPEPREFERESYRYAQTLVGQLTRKAGIGIRDTGGSMRYVLPAEVRYVEACRQQTLVHCLDGTVAVRRGFADLCRLFGSSLVTVHRSYAVNPQHVRAIEQYSILLDDDTEVPLPHKRAREMRDRLDQAMQRLSSEQGLREDTPPTITL